MSAQARGRGVR